MSLRNSDLLPGGQLRQYERQPSPEERVMSIPRKNFRNALAATIAVAFSICAAASTVYAQQSSDKAKADDQSIATEKKGPPSQLRTKEGGVIIEVPVIMMVPVQESDKLAMGKGCWVKLYDKKNFEGDSLLLIGPIQVGRMIGPFGTNWENKVRSLQTGPNSNLTIFDNRNFKDQDKFVDPNGQIPDLSKKMGLFDDFRSMILSCF